MRWLFSLNKFNGSKSANCFVTFWNWKFGFRVQTHKIIYASHTELGDKILIQTKIGIGTTADKFYPPYNNGLLFDGTLSYQYAEQEGPIYRGNSGLEYEESSSFSQTSTWLLSGMSMYFLSFVLFVL